ncbi:hypothetical protein CKO50_23445 [Pseudoalteromonas sp. HM-SA03]|nr:hypothetical protein CKO50_23445 [Pseudoalteromonas sp. HM-SA03]
MLLKKLVIGVYVFLDVKISLSRTAWERLRLAQLEALLLKPLFGPASKRSQFARFVRRRFLSVLQLVRCNLLSAILQ